MRSFDKLKRQLGIYRYNLTRKDPVVPQDWDEDSYFYRRPDVEGAVARGEYKSGYLHWYLHGRYEMESIEPMPVPKWLRNELRITADIDPEVFPSPLFLTKLGEYRPVRPNDVGVFFAKICKELGDQSFSHVFVLPWLKRGGADLEALHHIRALTKDYDARVLVILTEDTDSPWLERLPDSVATLRLGPYVSELDRDDAQLLLTRLLLRLNAPVIQNVNSALLWAAMGKYVAALRSVSKLYISLFCFDYTLAGQPVGYARLLEGVVEHVERVFVDNTAFARQLMGLYGFDSDVFAVLRFPVRIAPRFSYQPLPRPRILWAGRIDRQKRPDILLSIAQSMPECDFHVYGSRLLGDMSESLSVEHALRKLPNVKMMGEYDGFDSIPSDNYACLLYTTQWDGMPNVPLEALAAGLPVLAPDVGGIAEVITPESGFLVAHYDNPSEYVEKIREILNDPERITRERDRALDLLRERYSHETFSASLGCVESYTQPEPVASTVHSGD